MIAVFDIGKTNKKLFVFDERYRVAQEQSMRLEKTKDEDGDECENVSALASWIRQSFAAACSSTQLRIRAVNFAAYGASFVHLDRAGNILTPLYDYVKSYPSELQERLYEKYGGRETFSLQTASPPLGSLNSGLQLLRLKKTNPYVFTHVQYSLHLPQFVSWVVTGRHSCDLTSIGCHTALWDFSWQNYHQWVLDEGIASKFPPIRKSRETVVLKDGERAIISGHGLHDSSSALIPYFFQFSEPFLLLSTGTWNISLNPFNSDPLTVDELNKDCLFYLSFQGTPVKAARLFAGHDHDQFNKKLSEHFHVAENYFEQVRFVRHLAESIEPGQTEISAFGSFEESYHAMMQRLVDRQFSSTQLVMSSAVKRIYVDGGFSSNEVFMNLFAKEFPGQEVYAASLPHATALGAALAIHESWNDNPRPRDLIRLRPFPPTR